MGKAKRGRGGKSNPKPRQENWELGAVKNETFEAYYRAQNILPDEQWTPFIEAAQNPLPVTFRITASRAASKAVNEQVEKVFVPYLSKVEFEGVTQQPPKPLEWYPKHLAWQLNAAKHVVRKSPEFAKFQQFLVHESDSGNISRQEAVSMIPPLLLAVEPHHYVLDCCAAPGSKTGQLLEALHTPAEGSTSAATIPDGLLIANDNDAKRCHMLVHQSLNRIGSPNTMITNLDASTIPNIYHSDPKTPGKTAVLQFDRILCDVPCSGDGTTRKNPNIWKTWRTSDGLGLHGLQLRILKRAIQMLKPGGRLVYSTCSYNPIENEAVVSAALLACPNMSLIDVADKLPTLERRAGLTTWKVFDKQAQELASVDDIVKTDDKRTKGPNATCWPNGKEKENNLDRCLRLYPHLQDTGGFFVAVLEKSADGTDTVMEEEVQEPKPAETEAAVEAKSADETTTSGKRAASPSLSEQGGAKKVKQDEQSAEPSTAEANGTGEADAAETGEGNPASGMGQGRPFNEEPYSFLKEGDEQVLNCIDFFQFNDSFPASNLFVRNSSAQALRSIYMTSPIIRDLITHNDYQKLRLVSCGVKIFARQDAGVNGIYGCKWRVLQDGLNAVVPYMGEKRKVQASLSSLRKLCLDQYPPIEAFADDPDFQKGVKELQSGSGVCEFLAGDEAGGKLESSIVLPLWKAPISLCLMVEKTEKRGLSLRIFGEDLTAGASKKPTRAPAQPDKQVVEKAVKATEEEGAAKEEAKTAGADEAEKEEIKPEA